MRKYQKTFYISLIVLSCLISVLIIIGAVILYRFSKSEISDEVFESFRSSDSTLFFRYEKNDDGEIKNVPIQIEHSTDASIGYVSFDKIPNDLKNAFIAIEDRKFYTHSGINYLRSISAILNYCIKGKKQFGGSTITQQLVKNLTGNDSKVIKRKLTEAFSAMSLERKYDKTEIFEAYLNIINLSHGCRGVGDASHFYFSKDVSDLDLCESATIAAITNNPSKYDPVTNPQNNKQRRGLILGCMLDMGFISRDEYSSAVNKEIKLNLSKNTTQKTCQSWYIETVIDDVIHDLSKKYGIDKSTASLLFYKGGYKIYTAMDMRVQDCIESFYTDINNFPSDQNGRRPQSSMIVIDPHSGDILGIVGAIGEKKGSRLLNFAADSKRPSGSAIKPLSVYAPALDKGIIQWSSVMNDTPIREGKNGSAPWPSNANKQYLGKVTLDYAIKNSLNTVAVRLLHDVGADVSFNFLKDSLHIASLDTKRDMGDASLALGQHSTGISLRELVSGYCIFADGIMKKTRTYYKVTDANGCVILDNAPHEERVISNESAAIMTKLLQNVVTDGTARSLITVNDLTEVAGKTGTTQFNFDRYFIGYTPTLLAGVWQGYDYPTSLDFIGFNYSAIIWDNVIKSIYNECKPYSRQVIFDIPDNVMKIGYKYSLNDVFDEQNGEGTFAEGWFDTRRKDLEIKE